MNEIKYENKDKTKLYYIKDLSTKKTTKNYMFIILVILLLLGITSILLSISKIDVIGNSEIGSVDYTVYLKDNDFYTNKYLKKGDSEANNYIASLIDTFDVNFVYNSSYSRLIDYEYEYKIDCKILVTDKYDNSKVLYSKDESLLDTQRSFGKNSNISINEDVTIDYGKYNSYVSAFKDKYSLDVESSLIITMNITTKGSYGVKEIPVKTSTLTMTIPLTKNTIDISINTSELSNNYDIAVNESIIGNKFLFSLGIGLCSVAVIAFVLILLLNRKKNDIYRKTVDGILKNYDRLIITSSQPSIEESTYKNKVRVMSIEELLDVNELTKEPIIYYEVEPNNKSYFIILKQDTLYKLTISRAYLEKEEAEKRANKGIKKED
jgi:hypothetical protein